jgi:hypothetical protein
MKEQKRNISSTFIQDCFNAIFPCIGLEKLIDSLEHDDVQVSRSRLHDIAESLKPPVTQLESEDERILHNAKVEKYTKVNNLYDKLLSMIEQNDLRMVPKEEHEFKSN